MSNLPYSLRPLLADRVETDGDHLLWTGPMDRTVPILKVGGVKYRVRRLVLAHLLGRDLIGEVTTCEHDRCVAPGHLLDEVGRRNTAATEAMIDALEQVMPALLAREAARTAEEVAA